MSTCFVPLKDTWRGHRHADNEVGLLQNVVCHGSGSV